MNAQQAYDLITCIDPEQGANIAEVLIPILFEKSTIGVACHMFACACCGTEFIVFHVIPIRPPVECPTCNKIQGYIVNELR